MDSMQDKKIVIIHPDGTFKYLGDAFNDEETHAMCLLDYAAEKYPEAQMFKRLTIRHQPSDVAFFYNLLGDIVITNNTKFEKKHGKMGTAFFPDDITKEQLAVLYNVADDMSNFQMCLAYDLEVVDGIITGQEKWGGLENNFHQLLDAYFEEQKDRKQK